MVLSPLFFPQIAGANGGAIAFAGDRGPFNVTIQYSPNPPNPGEPLHLSMLLTKASSDVQVKDATAIAAPSMPSMAMGGAEPVRFTQTASRLNLYDVDIPVGMEGIWQVNIQIISPQLGQTQFELPFKVEKTSPAWGIIVGIMVALPLMAGLTWWFLFRGTPEEKSEEVEAVEE